jgi:hypothetical protein
MYIGTSLGTKVMTEMWTKIFVEMVAFQIRQLPTDELQPEDAEAFLRVGLWLGGRNDELSVNSGHRAYFKRRPRCVILQVRTHCCIIL